MGFPIGVTISNGEFTMRERVRGDRGEGLFVATSRGGSDVWVTLRAIRPTPERLRLLSFSCFGIPAPLYVGTPDFDEEDRDNFLAVVDAAPSGRS